MSRVLLIDSDPSSDALLRAPLADFKLDLHTATSGIEGLALSLERPPTLILLSLTLPDMDGVQVLRQLRARTRTAHIPVIILAPRQLSNRQNEVLQAGADDFVTKPFDMDIVSLRVRNSVQRAMRDGLHHPQTGLPMGRLVLERIRELADEYNWYKIDFEIDAFAAFRETYGFMSGQEVISFTASILVDCVHEAGTPEDFIGQRSDTEYVIVTQLDRGPALRDLVQTRFNEGVLAFYNFMEREQGFIELEDSHGELVRHALMNAKIKVQEGEPE